MYLKRTLSGLNYGVSGSDAKNVSLSFRQWALSGGGRGAPVLGGLDEGQIPAVSTAGAEPECGETHPGYSPKVKSYIILLSVDTQRCPRAHAPWDLNICKWSNTFLQWKWVLSASCICLSCKGYHHKRSVGERGGNKLYCCAEKTGPTRGAGYDLIFFWPLLMLHLCLYHFISCCRSKTFWCTHVYLLNFIPSCPLSVEHLLWYLSSCLTSLTVASGQPVNQSSAVDNRESEVSGFPCKRNTITESVTTLFIHHSQSLWFCVCQGATCQIFFFSFLQRQPQETRHLTPWGTRRTQRTVSTWIPVSWLTQTVNKRVFLCQRRRCRGRYHVHFQQQNIVLWMCEYYWAQVIFLFFRSALAYTHQHIIPQKTVVTMWMGKSMCATASFSLYKYIFHLFFLLTDHIQKR